MRDVEGLEFIRSQSRIELQSVDAFNFKLKMMLIFVLVSSILVL